MFFVCRAFKICTELFRLNRSLCASENESGITVGYNFHYIYLGAVVPMVSNAFRIFTVPVMCCNLCTGLSTTFGCTDQCVVFSAGQLYSMYAWNSFH